MEHLSFYFLAFVSVASALGVVILRDALHSALSLIVHLLGIAALFAYLDAHFLAAVQVVVYAGAIMVLTVFVIMLLNSKTETVSSSGVWLGLIGGISAAALLFAFVPQIDFGFVAENPFEVISIGSAKELGIKLFTLYVFPVQVAGFLLLAALVGAAMLARRSTKVSEEES